LTVTVLAYNSHEILQFSDYVAEFKHRLCTHEAIWMVNSSTPFLSDNSNSLCLEQ
jgi:hypothetical protein